MKNILEQIILNKKQDIAKRKKSFPPSFLKESQQQYARNLNFFETIKQKVLLKTPALIAEIKKASPSAGLIRGNFNAIEIAQSYLNAGACCLSILTEGKYFLGSDEYVKQVSKKTPLPILRKDFTIDAYQINESKAIGADCVLLILAILDIQKAKELEALAFENNLSVLVEVHNLAELELALKHLNSPLIGINNRNLKTLQTDVNTCINLAKYVPKEKIIVAESGLKTSLEINKLKQNNIYSYLIGESFLKQQNIENAVKEIVF